MRVRQPIAPELLSRLQRHILAWLGAEALRTCGITAASHHDLRRVLAYGVMMILETSSSLPSM